MPLYIVQHSVPLEEATREALVQVITTAHTRRFTVPKFFVHVSFEDVSSRQEYRGGKRINANRIIATIRPSAPGGERSDDAIEALLREILDGWNRLVGAHGKEGLGVIFAQKSLDVVLEHGFLIPKAGQDSEWIRKNLDVFRERAKDDPAFGELVAELEARST